MGRYEQTDYVLKLEIPISICVYGEYDKQIVGEQISEAVLNKIHYLRDDGWNDGRYPYWRETFGLALSHLLKDIVRVSLEFIIGEKIGPNHMTKIENGAYNTSSNMAGELTKQITVVVEQEKWKASID